MEQDKNLLDNLHWRAAIRKAPNVSYLMQRVSIPSITLPPAGQPNPNVIIPHPGDHITYDYLRLEYKVDEELDNYLEVFNWITNLGFPEDSSQFAEIEADQRSDISIIKNSSKHNPSSEFVFHDAFPVYLGELPLDQTSTDVKYISNIVVFAYTHFTVRKY